MGVVQFTHSMFNSYPTLFRFHNEKIAVKHVGKYSFVSSFLESCIICQHEDILTNCITNYILFRHLLEARLNQTQLC